MMSWSEEAVLTAESKGGTMVEAAELGVAAGLGGFPLVLSRDVDAGAVLLQAMSAAPSPTPHPASSVPRVVEADKAQSGVFRLLVLADLRDDLDALGLECKHCASPRRCSMSSGDSAFFLFFREVVAAPLKAWLVCIFVYACVYSIYMYVGTNG